MSKCELCGDNDALPSHNLCSLCETDSQMIGQNTEFAFEKERDLRNE